MQEMIHILKKDLRFLRLEILVFTGLCALYAWTQLSAGDRSTVQGLLVLAALYVIARVIHAESLPGTNQFWLSRPYHWRSLLTAKLAFVLLTINLPLFTARAVVLLAQGFSPASFLPKLLWSQAVFCAVICGPAMALAALTPGLVSFALAAILILIAGEIAGEVTIAPSPLAARTLVFSEQWIWNSLVAAILIGAAVVTVVAQYRRRRTLAGRIGGVLAIVCAAVCYLYIPWSFGANLQTLLSKRGPMPELSVRLGSESRARMWPKPADHSMELDFPLEVAGVPQGTYLVVDALSLDVIGADGQTWRSGPFGAPVIKRESATDLRAAVTAPETFLHGTSQQTVSIRGSLYVTLFGSATQNTIPLQDRPVRVGAGMQCIYGTKKYIYCTAPLRWPGRLVYAEFGPNEIRSFTHPVSYSPFPAGVDLDTVDMDMLAPPDTAREATIVSMAPLRHMKLRIDLPDLRVLGPDDAIPAIGDRFVSPPPSRPTSKSVGPKPSHRPY